MGKTEFDLLDNIFNNSPKLNIDDSDKFVIFSDFHLGSRKKRDDFTNNSEMFFHIIKKYYYDHRFKLVLNGDIEELQRIRLDTIKSRWADLYDIFEMFDNEKRLFKLIGNHDSALSRESHSDINRQLLDGLVLLYKECPIFIFHGHQVSGYYSKAAQISKFFLRYFANPLGIKNITRSFENQKIHKLEQKVYEFSNSRKIISIIGHTHRPLFESVSEIAMIKYKIENLVRSYINAPEEKLHSIKKEILQSRIELSRLQNDNIDYASVESKYSENGLVIPSIFNSGSVIGKNGMTAIEISGGDISLVLWVDKNKKGKYVKYYDSITEQIDGTSFYRYTLKSDSIVYISTKIKLLME